MANQKIFCSMFLPFLVYSFIVAPVRVAPTPSPRANLPINYIFNFGDSLSDTGNLIRVGFAGSQTICGRLPYGETLGIPTGRCSDGYLMVDYIAEYFGLPHLSPYLNRRADFSHGVNFAVAGSTALDTAALARRGLGAPPTNSPLSVQLKWFRSHLNSLCHGPSDCKNFLKNSLVLMGEIGGNDYNYALLQGRTIEEVQGLVPEVVQVIKAAVEELINVGATKIVVPGNFPIGCMPIYLANFQSNDQNKYDELNCLKDLNDFAHFHNNKLEQAIKELQQEHPNVAIAYGDYYNGLRWILKNAASLGFNGDDIQKACCGVVNVNKYNFDVRRMCTLGVPVCSNPNERFSWDGIHLTQHAYQRMADYLLRRTNLVPSLIYS